MDDMQIFKISMGLTEEVITDPGKMPLKVAFRPVPAGYDDPVVLDFRDELQYRFREFEIQWDKVFNSEGQVIAGINAVIDVTRPEKDHAIYFLEDRLNSQIVVLEKLNEVLADPETGYQEKIKVGLEGLTGNMSSIVLGISDDRITLTNMNLSDSVIPRENVYGFIEHTLKPKLWAPIKPLTLDNFILGDMDPEASGYSLELLRLSREMAKSGLFPKGSSIAGMMSNRRDRMVSQNILDGRTGVSYGFIGYAEPPRNGKIWVQSSRSGSDKTNLDPEKDIVRIGLVEGKLYMQTPPGIDPRKMNMRPSYDTFVMLAQSLSAYLHQPGLIREGMPIVHFHGYPHPDWFRDREYFTGQHNNAFACGTVQAAYLNYLAIKDLPADTRLAAIVEPDHGVNIIGRELDYVISRLTESSGMIELGGRYLDDLKRTG